MTCFMRLADDSSIRQNLPDVVLIFSKRKQISVYYTWVPFAHIVGGSLELFAALFLAVTQSFSHAYDKQWLPEYLVGAQVQCSLSNTACTVV
jgi:hypothetical protein